MILVTGAVWAREGCLDALWALAVEHVRRSRAEPGCLAHDVYRDPDEPMRLVFVERWADRAALAAHFAVPASRTFVKTAASLARARPVMELFDAAAFEPAALATATPTAPAPGAPPVAGALDGVVPVLRVADLGRSIAFYRDGVGFAVDFTHGDHYAGLSCDGHRLHLRRAAPLPRDQQAFERGEFIDLCLLARDAGAMARRLAERGAPVVVALRAMPYGREVYVRDPDGYVLGVIQPGAPAD
jgi:quinol monooxygenase YgiN/predicted enzyme related to lactoylglutathione lyase